MQAQSTVIAHPENIEQVNALKAVMKALKIKFEITVAEKPYNQEFVDMVLNAKQEIKDGKSLTVTAEQFDDLWK